MPQGLKEASEGDMGSTLIDFGTLDNEGRFKSRKMRVKVCGRHIHNYPSEKAISRTGWLQLCVLAKDSIFHKVIELCRNWDEFWELNTLAKCQYFPSGKWSLWRGDRLRDQLHELVSLSVPLLWLNRHLD